jgi:hypothetical protein
MLDNDSDRSTEDELALRLPALGDDESDEDGLDDDCDPEIDTAGDGGDPFDDAAAADIPLDPMIATANEEPTAIGDDSTGLDHIPASEGVQLEENGQSMLGTDDDGPTRDGDEDFGVGMVVGDDDGGVEGVIDPLAEHVDELPPLDGQEHDGEEARDDQLIDDLPLHKV